MVVVLGESQMQSQNDDMPIIIDELEPGPSTVTQPEAEVAVVDLPPTEPSTDTVRSELDEEILILLGQTPSKDKKFGPEIQQDLALRLEHIATMGLTKESRKELLDKHYTPKNCTKVDAPRLNPEIKAALSEMLIKKDKALEQKQSQLAAAIACIGDALTKLFSSEQRDPTVIKLLIEGSRLMCDAQYKESLTRRSFICSTIKKDIKDHLYNTEIDQFLFGEKLADTLKAAKAISKSGAEIKINTSAKKSNVGPKAKQPPTQSLNQRPPPPPARQAGVTRRPEPAPAQRARPQQPPRPPPRSQHYQGPRR